MPEKLQEVTVYEWRNSPPPLDVAAHCHSADFKNSFCLYKNPVHIKLSGKISGWEKNKQQYKQSCCWT